MSSFGLSSIVHRKYCHLMESLFPLNRLGDTEKDLEIKTSTTDAAIFIFWGISTDHTRSQSLVNESTI